MGFIPEGIQGESPLASFESPAKRRQSRRFDTVGTQEKSLRTLHEFEAFPGLNP